MNRKPQKFLWITGLKPEKAADYRRLHAHPWPGVMQKLAECNIREFTVYEKELAGTLYLFASVEYTGGNFDADMKTLAADPETQRWWAETDPCQQPLPDALARGSIWSETTEIFRIPELVSS